MTDDKDNELVMSAEEQVVRSVKMSKEFLDILNGTSSLSDSEVDKVILKDIKNVFEELERRLSNDPAEMKRRKKMYKSLLSIMEYALLEKS